MPETLARVETKLDTLTCEVHDMKDKLYGNGKNGIIVDQLLQSQQITQLLDYAKINATSIEGLKNVSTPNWLARNWLKIVGTLTLGVIVIHSFIPSNITIWQLLGILK